MFVPLFSTRSVRNRFKRAGGGASGSSSSGSSSSSSGSRGGSSSSGSSSSGSSSSSSGSRGGSGSTGSSSSGGSSSSNGNKGSSGSSGSSSSGSKGSSGAGGSGAPLTGKTGSTSSTSSSIYGSTKSITPYSSGSPNKITIPSGQLFAGRAAGGGTRSDVYGTRTYGSGYPGISSRGVAGHGFPFYFWPVVWGGAAGGTAAYLYDENEYPNNSSRPGGLLMTAAFQSSSTSSIFRILSDNTTVVYLISDIHANCSSHLTSTSASSPSSAVPYNASAPDAPKPEQVIQYYRASSVSLSLDGYNNMAIFNSSDSAPDIPLPSGIDTTLLECLNATIGVAVPLVDSDDAGTAPANAGQPEPTTWMNAGSAQWAMPKCGTIGLVWIVMYLTNCF